MQSNDLTVTITRLLSAQVEAVFSAWTDASGLRFWWEPGGTTVENAQIDLRVGGQFQITSIAPERGVTIVISGSYQEVSAPRHLMFTWTWQEANESVLVENSLVTLEFTPSDSQTQVSLIHTGFPSASARDRHFDGWQQTFRSFNEYLEQRVS